MRVESIQGGMNFNGTVTVSKELNPKLAKYMSNLAENSGIKQKPYNLHIGNYEGDNFVSVEAINPEDLNEKYRVMVHKVMQKKEILQNTVKEAMENFEKMVNSKNKV